jgi:hypothetical protein
MSMKNLLQNVGKVIDDFRNGIAVELMKKEQALGALKNSLFWGLFKNAQMQGTQKPNREAYIEIR